MSFHPKTCMKGKWNSQKPDQSGILYICATPIGNLDDCTFRLIDTLKHVDIIAAEDTRVTATLLHRYDIHVPQLLSLQKYNEKEKSDALIYHLSQGKSIALVSDAGTPNIADPGAWLVKQVQQHAIPIVAIPGPSSITTGLSVSGLLANQFIFGGFFPKKSELSQPILEAAHHLQTAPIVFFESARRLKETLAWLMAHSDMEQLVLCKELTKTFETILSGSAEAVMAQLDDHLIKGEWVIIFTLKPQEKDTEALAKFAADMVAQKLSLKQTLHIGIAYQGFRKNDLYQRYQELTA